MAHKKLDSVTIFLLAVILAIAAVLTYYPHLNYPFPLHVDEWFHIAEAQNIAVTHALPHYDIYLSRPPIATDVENGYHVLLAAIFIAFKPTITQWVYLPSVLQILAVLSV